MSNTSNVMLNHYEHLAASYHQHRGTFDVSGLFEAFFASIARPSTGLVLDLGCGAGDGFPAYFSQAGWQVEGLDFSANMLELCKEYHPEIATRLIDLTQVEIAPARYDVIESIYALFHLSNEQQHQLLQKCYEGLKPGGYLYFTYATQAYTGSPVFEGHVDFMGSPLFYAHQRPECLEEALRQMGFHHLHMEQREIAGESFLWVFAQK